MALDPLIQYSAFDFSCLDTKYSDNFSEIKIHITKFSLNVITKLVVGKLAAIQISIDDPFSNYGVAQFPNSCLHLVHHFPALEKRISGPFRNGSSPKREMSFARRLSPPSK